MRGAYTWTALLDDGRVITEFDAAGDQQSVDRLRHESVRALILEPRPGYDGFVAIRIDIAGDDQWIKHWTSVHYADMAAGTSHEAFHMDVFGLHHPERPTRLYICADGSIVMRTTPLI